jgi:HlyD family secretion protein
MRAVVHLAAAPGRQLSGTVESVSAFPLSGRWPNRDRREYEAVVELDDACADLAPGLTADVELIAGSRDDAMQAPIAAVAKIDDRHVAFVRRGEEIEPREVTVGITSDDMIEIVDGLEEGEQVVLAPRDHCPEAIEEWQAAYEEAAEPEVRGSLAAH